MTTAHRAADSPFATAVEAGKDYWWCACGLSKNQPLCDGSHKGCRFTPDEVQRHREQDGLLLRLQGQRQPAPV